MPAEVPVSPAGTCSGRQIWRSWFPVRRNTGLLVEVLKFSRGELQQRGLMLLFVVYVVLQIIG